MVWEIPGDGTIIPNLFTQLHGYGSSHNPDLPSVGKPGSNCFPDALKIAVIFFSGCPLQHSDMWCEALEVCWPHKPCFPSCCVQRKWFCEEIIKSSESVVFSKGIAESQHSICKSYTLAEPPACSGGLFCSNSSDLLWWVKQFCDLPSVPMDTNTMALDPVWVFVKQWCGSDGSILIHWNTELQAPWLAVTTNGCHVLISDFGKLSFPSRSPGLNGWRVSLIPREICRRGLWDLACRGLGFLLRDVNMGTLHPCNNNKMLHPCNNVLIPVAGGRKLNCLWKHTKVLGECT